MGLTKDLGRRVELVSMDPHCSNITISLYLQANDGAPHYLVHSYSGLPATHARLEAIERAMRVLGGLSPQNGALRFPCGAGHQLAMRRTFLEACKLASDSPAEVRPLTTEEKKSG